MKTWIGVVLLGLSLGAKAQKVNVDSLRKVKVPVVVGDTLQPYDTTLKVDSLTAATKPTSRKIVPKKATTFALIIPGGGQVYNRDFWKLPLVYGGFGAAGYMYYWNIIRYKEFRRAYLTSIDLNTGLPINKTEYQVYIHSEKEYRTLTLDQVKRGTAFYRRYRDLSYVVMGAVYALSVIEANVAAHLKTFDVSEDLTLRLEPSMERTFLAPPATGIKLVLMLK